jgi:Arc/MetJ family transcription regulator
MRTTLNLDEEALTKALEVASVKTKTAVINEALRDFARRRDLRGFLKWEGKLQWKGNLDALRKRERRK